MNILKDIRSEEVKRQIRERCGTNITADGLRCPHCGAYETYKDKDDINNVEKWAFMIKAFRVDNLSHCLNCEKWF